MLFACMQPDLVMVVACSVPNGGCSSECFPTSRFRFVAHMRSALVFMHAAGCINQGSRLGSLCAGPSAAKVGCVGFLRFSSHVGLLRRLISLWPQRCRSWFQLYNSYGIFVSDAVVVSDAMFRSSLRCCLLHFLLSCTKGASPSLTSIPPFPHGHMM